jgi:histidinol-phosphate aminotransferase
MSIFKTHIAAMSAYKPPLDGRDPHAHLLLDFNERTLPMAEVVQQALIDYIKSGRLQMYPAYGNVTDLIADYCGVPQDQVMITNGSDQGIDLIIRAACREGDEAIIPGPSFPIYTHCAKIENLNIIEPEYTLEHGFPTQDVINAITPKTRLICFGNPNNPSGTVVPKQDIERILKAAPQAVVLVDECYYEYMGDSMCQHISDYPNLLITRTFSKTWGMPSLRLGYILAQADNIRALLNVRGPYDINQMAIVAIRAALAHPKYTQDYVQEVMHQSKPMFEAFLAQQQIPFWPSGANYVWLFPKNPQAIYQALLNAQIMVRPKADAKGIMGLRITLGTVPQTQRLIDEMQVALQC